MNDGEKMKDRILIVEDDSVIAELEKEYLSARGFYVDICSNGKDGFDAAVSCDYSLIILDVMIPEIDGFEVCRRLREVKDTPVLFVTAKQEADDVVSGFSLGADDYITKPFNFREFAARVEARISRYKSINAGRKDFTDVIEIGCLKLCLSSRRVYVDGAEIVMTNKEFDLIWFLASNPNIVFSKEQIFEEIWGCDPMGETSTVTVHINRIRDKIDKNSSGVQHIETIWGTGYRFKS